MTISLRSDSFGTYGAVQFNGVDVVKITDKGIVPLAGQAPCFSAYRNTSQTIGATLTTLACDVEQYDTSGSLSAGVFTCPVAGYYQFNGYAANATTACVMNSRFKKNAAEFYNGNYPTSNVNSIAASALIYLALGDTVEYQVYQSTSQSVLTGVGGNFFQGFLVRPA